MADADLVLLWLPCGQPCFFFLVNDLDAASRSISALSTTKEAAVYSQTLSMCGEERVCRTTDGICATETDVSRHERLRRQRGMTGSVLRTLACKMRPACCCRCCCCCCWLLGQMCYFVILGRTLFWGCKRTLVGGGKGSKRAKSKEGGEADVMSNDSDDLVRAGYGRARACTTKKQSRLQVLSSIPRRIKS